MYNFKWNKVLEYEFLEELLSLKKGNNWIRLCVSHYAWTQQIVLMHGSFSIEIGFCVMDVVK